jgi:iron complex outermembrane receptor protein
LSLRPPAIQVAAALALACATGARAAQDLTTLSLEQLMRLTVVGASKYEQEQNEVGAAVRVTTREEIRAFGWRTLEEVIAGLPGVHVTYDRQYTYVGLRGFGLPGDYNTRVLVTINGNRANDVTYDSGPFGRTLPLDLDLVDRIEFIPGPGGAVYGQNAMFGVVNIVTRQGASVDGAELAAGWQGPQRLREGRVSFGRRLADGTDVLLSASGLRAGGEDRVFDYGAAGVTGVAAGLDGERDKELFARVGRGRWAIDFLYGDRRKDDPTGAYLSDPLVPGQFQGDRYTLAQWQYEAPLRGDSLRLSSRLFTGSEHYTSDFRYGTWFSFPASSRWHGGELRLLSTGWDGHKLMFGIEAQDNDYRQEIRDRSDPANDIVLPGSSWRAGAFAQDEWRIADTLVATLGLRLDRNRVSGTDASPRAALIWMPSAATTTKALFGRAHRAPNAYEREYDDGFAQVGNPSLRGESIDTWELVTDHRATDGLLLRGSVYRWRMKGLITLGIDPVSGVPQYQSGAAVRAVGAELSADRRWGGGTTLRGSVSRQHVRDARGQPLLNSPERLGKLQFTTPLAGSGWQVAYELQLESGRRTLDGSALGGFAVSNLNLTRDFGRHAHASIGALNLLDKRYAYPGADTNWQNALEQDGRSVRLQVQANF